MRKCRPQVQTRGSASGPAMTYVVGETRAVRPGGQQASESQVWAEVLASPQLWGLSKDTASWSPVNTLLRTPISTHRVLEIIRVTVTCKLPCVR